MEQQRKLSRYELEQAVVLKAWTDEKFLDQLKKDPKGAIKQSLGVQMPADLNVRIYEEDANTVCIPIAVHPQKLMDTELNDAQLSAIAGGVGSVSQMVPRASTTPNWMAGLNIIDKTQATPQSETAFSYSHIPQIQ